MHVHFTVESETVRVYLTGNADSYGNREPYDAVATIKYCDDVAHVSAAHGTMPLEVCRAIYEHCKASGATRITWEHNAKQRCAE